MKKWFIVLLLVFCPIVLMAEECDYKKHTEYSNYASLITYENEYSMGDQIFSVKFYNVIKGLYLQVGKTKYEPDETDTVTISGISEGTKLEVYVYANDGCKTQVHNINISLPYYNPYYDTAICKGYEKLTLCASKFTASKATKEMIEKTKANYDEVIIQEEDPNETKPDSKEPVINKIKKIFFDYILKILLVLGSSALSIWYYNNKLLKIEHGI